MKYFKLNNGVLMPAIGLGTFPMNNSLLVDTIHNAIEVGFNSFDTADAYKNEEYLGRGLENCLKERKDIFMTTKLSNRQQRAGDVASALNQSLKYLKLEYIDLYLMHWPNPQTFLDSWKQMEKLYKDGYCRAIGVCNFHQHHLKDLLSVAEIIPAINQIEIHPFLSQKPLIEFCKSLNIQVEAYAPLARMDLNLINNSTLVALAKKYNKTVVQIILRWNYQCGVITIPKTQNKERLKENISIFDFEISDNDINLINQLNCDYRVRHNPDNCDFSKL